MRLDRGLVVTDREWLSSRDPYRMLRELRGRVSDRKLRLLACACYRLRATLANRPEVEEAITLVESWADGLPVESDGPGVREFIAETGNDGPLRGFEFLFFGEAYYGAHFAVMVGSGSTRVGTAECCRYLRCIFGNPCPAAYPWVWQWPGGLTAGSFTSDVVVPTPLSVPAVDPAWLTPTVTALARRLYVTGDFAAMPILADALEDGGCTNADVLEHCRSAHPHVRGCWVVDRVLGKD